MEDRIDAFFDLFKNNKRLLFFTFILYIILMIVIIIFIWKPKEVTYGKFDIINATEKATNDGKSYINKITLFLKSKSKGDLEKLISPEYINYTGKSAAEIVEDLSNLMGSGARCEGFVLYQDGDTYIYTTTINSNGATKKLNIIEQKPYEYTIAFDNFYKYRNTSRTYSDNNIDFRINSIYNNLGYMQYNMSITNNNIADVTLNFNDSSRIALVTTSQQVYYLENVTSMDKSTILSNGVTMEKSLVFGIPVQNQSDISYIVFRDAIVNNQTTKITIEL